MKKILAMFLLTMSVLISGCGESLNNTPTKQVEMFFMNYQTLDSDVIIDLDKVLESDTSMNNEQKEKYKEIMKKHYKNLSYDVKNEMVNGDTAVVTVEIEVYDYSKKMLDINEYLLDNPEEFVGENNNYNQEKFMDYRLSELEKVEDKVKYTLDLSLTKYDEE